MVADGELRYSLSSLKPGYRASYFFFLDGVRFDIENLSGTEGISEGRRLEVMNCVRRFVEETEGCAGEMVGVPMEVTVWGETYVVS